MEYKGAGTVPLEHPPIELKPFMRRKLKTWMRSFAACSGKVMYRIALEDEAYSHAQMYPEAERQNIVDLRMKAWDFLLMAGSKKDMLKEEDFIEIWMNRIYSDPPTRKKLLEEQNEAAAIFFNGTDTNKDGFVDFEEFTAGAKVLKPAAIRFLFNAVDLNGDGVISLEEFQYVTAYHHFSSEPGHPFTTFYGPIVKEYD